VAKPTPLREAARAYAAGRYSQAISLLESQVFRYRESFDFYYLLGMSCLRVGDYGGAYSYLKRAQQLNPEHVDTSLALAVVHVRRHETPRALSEWLAVLDRDPRNRRARRGLAVIRGMVDGESVDDVATDRQLEGLIPSPGFRIPVWVFPAIGIAALVAIGVLTGPRIVDRIVASRTETRDGFEVMGELPEEVTDYSGAFRYVLSEREIEQTFQKIGEYFNDFRDSMARREINRILHSNASAAVKERARLLIDFLQAPTFANLRDNFSYAEVAQEPWLYNGCWVRWRGRVSNLEIGEEWIRFVFLVGYEDQRNLEGTIPVRLGFAADLDVEAIELIGQVEYADARLGLQGTSVRQIVPRGQDRR
jgi:hypothetical protein